LTAEAREFVTPLTLQTLSGRRAYTDLFSLEESSVIHTSLADHARLILIAPATANLIGKLANGLADDLLTCVVMASTAPVLLAPAMNVHMYNHPAVRTNLKRLKQLGYHVIGPDVGSLACGYDAIGHLADVEEIVQAALRLAARPPARNAP
jgi:phosphopantothenoylcysteine decarboxylase/phosphopantothenate--cysteine ligase